MVRTPSGILSASAECELCDKLFSAVFFLDEQIARIIYEELPGQPATELNSKQPTRGVHGGRWRGAWDWGRRGRLTRLRGRARGRQKLIEERSRH